MVDDYNINLMLYCDMAISVLKSVKDEYLEISNTNNLRDIRRMNKKVKDAKYLFFEILAIIATRKSEINNLYKKDLDE